MNANTQSINLASTFNEISESKRSDVDNPTDAKLLALLAQNDPLIRGDIVKHTKIARSTVYDSLLRLIIKGHVIKFAERPIGPGRPKIYYQLLKKV